MNSKYCPDCNLRLIHKVIESNNIYCCTNCGKIFSQTENGFKYLFQTSGNNALKELFSFIETKEST